MSMSSMCIIKPHSFVHLPNAQGTQLEEGFSKSPVHCNKECCFLILKIVLESFYLADFCTICFMFRPGQ